MKIKITLGHLAEALYQLRKEYGLFANYTEEEILERAIKNEQMELE